VSYEDLQDPFMRQNTPFKISVLDFHNCPLFITPALHAKRGRISSYFEMVTEHPWRKVTSRCRRRGDRSRALHSARSISPEQRERCSDGLQEE